MRALYRLMVYALIAAFGAACIGKAVASFGRIETQTQYIAAQAD